MVGDVDAGKSTILGRLMVDLEQVTPKKLAELEAMSAKRGVAVEYSFLLDSFQLERDQAITLDVSRIWLRTAGRDFVFVDAPGHRELVRNLLSGASEVDTAILVVAADEGITIQTRRHALFLKWFGFTEVVVVINKLDLSAEKETAFAQRAAEVREFLEQLGRHADRDRSDRRARRRQRRRAVPDAAVVEGSDAADVTRAAAPDKPAPGGPLRFVVQDVFRRDADRLIAGRVESGTLRVGERLVFWPLQAAAVVKEIVQWPNNVEEGRRPTRPSPLRSTNASSWIAARSPATPETDRRSATRCRRPSSGSERSPCMPGEALRMRIATREIPVTLQRIDEVIDPDTLERAAGQEVIQGESRSLR